MLPRKKILRLRNKGVKSAREIARRLGYRSRKIQLEVQAILLDAGIPQRRCWTKDELDILRVRFPSTPTLQLAKELNRSLSSTYETAHKLGLRRLDNPGSIKKGERRGISGEFKKGQISWNAGKKIGSHGRSKETQFKKGQPSRNELFDGAISIRTDHKDRHNRKYKWIRMSKSKWKMLHVHIYEHFEGPIPPGHIVVFADGDSMNCRLDNLRCIDRVQHAHDSQMKDGYIAARLAAKWIDGHPGIDRDLYQRILKDPALIEAKRQQMQLKRLLKEQR